MAIKACLSVEKLSLSRKHSDRKTDGKGSRAELHIQVRFVTVNNVAWAAPFIRWQTHETANKQWKAVQIGIDTPFSAVHNPPPPPPTTFYIYQETIYVIDLWAFRFPRPSLPAEHPTFNSSGAPGRGGGGGGGHYVIRGREAQVVCKCNFTAADESLLLLLLLLLPLLQLVKNFLVELSWMGDGVAIGEMGNSWMNGSWFNWYYKMHTKS